MQTSNQSKLPIYAALGANAAIAIIKFIASRISGSSAMLSESIHSAVDCANSLLILKGISRSKRPPDKWHPFGHGKELYFYALIVSIMVFTFGGGMSIYEGITHLQHPTPLSNPSINYIVLGSAILFECISMYLALKNFMKVKGDHGFWQGLRLSKDPSLFAIIYEDMAAVAGLFIALGGVMLSHYFQSTVYDGVASLLIGVLLCGVAAIMLTETRSLLIGESANEEIVNGILQGLEADPDVHNVQMPLTMQMAPHEILVALNVEFKPHLKSCEVATVILRLEKEIQSRYPDVSHIFIEANNIVKVWSMDAELLSEMDKRKS